MGLNMKNTKQKAAKRGRPRKTPEKKVPAKDKISQHSTRGGGASAEKKVLVKAETPEVEKVDDAITAWDCLKEPEQPEKVVTNEEQPKEAVSEEIHTETVVTTEEPEEPETETLGEVQNTEDQEETDQKLSDALESLQEEKATIDPNPETKPRTEPYSTPKGLTDGSDHIPSVTSQGFRVNFIENDSLCGAKGTPRFNGSFTIWNGKRLIAYRFYDETKNECQLGISELDQENRIISNHPLKFRAHGNTGSFMDPRLFIHEGQLWISFAEWSMNPGHQCLVRCVSLGGEYRPARDLTIRYGANYKAGFEKNWMFLSRGKELWFCYKLSEGIMVRVCPLTGKVLEEKKGKHVTWLLDHLRGGSCFIPWGEDFIGFYHSGSDHQWMLRRYGLGAVVLDGKTFALKSMSLPFIYGSRNDPFIERSRPGNVNCVFVAGAVDTGNEITVSAGVNDSSNALIRIPKDKLNEVLEPSENWHGRRGKFFSIRGCKSVPTLFGFEQVGKIVSVSGIHGQTKYLNTDDPVTIAYADTVDWINPIEPEEYSRQVETIKAKMHFPPQRIPDYLKRKR